MLVAVPPAQPAVPLAQSAIVRKTTVGVPRKRHAHIHLAHPHRHPHPGHSHAHSAHPRRHSTDTGYRPAQASWYGGGGGLACGGTLTSSTLGVANKTLPCGTVIYLRYHGRKVMVRVIDRGPFVAGREFDLTEATKRALGFGDLGEVWWRPRGH